MFRERQQIGNYTLIKQIGRGGFGEVWLAERRTALLTTKVAVKLPLDSLIDLETVRQEAVLWEKASGHPNVLPIIEANIFDGQVIIVSEFAPDGSLSDLLKKTGKLLPEKAVEIAIGITAGLEFLHSRRIIHRDIKPANILLQGETPRLADFGISHALQTSVASRSANIKGTFSYMAPETFDGKRNEQTDIWAVGVVLYQMLMGELPFPQTDTTALFGAIVMREPEPLPDDVPGKLKEIVGKALAKLPENRYKSAREMRDDLQKVLVGLTHPTFAPTEVLTKKSIEPVLDTIESEKSVITQMPLTILPETQPARTAPFVTRPVQNAAPAVNEFPIPDTVFSPSQPEIEQPPKKSASKRSKRFVYISLLVVGLLGLIVISPGLIFLFVKFTTPAVKITERDSRLPSIAGIKLIPCQGEARWGFCDASGKVYVEQKYLDAQPFVEGFALVEVENYWLGAKNGFIDSNGREIVFRDYTYVYPYSEGLAMVRKPGGDKSGFIDQNFQEVIPLKYGDVYPFQNGLAAVNSDSRLAETEARPGFGFIDKSGQMVLPEKYINPSGFSEGLASAFLSSEGPGCGYFDASGKTVIPFKYPACGRFAGGLAKVKLNTKWGYIDKTGSLVIPAIYDEAGDFSEGLAAVRLNNKIGFIDKTSAAVIPFKYDIGDYAVSSTFNGGLAPVALNGKWGYINRSDRVVIPFQYKSAEPFEDGVAEVRNDAFVKQYISAK